MTSSESPLYQNITIGRVADEVEPHKNKDEKERRGREGGRKAVLNPGKAFCRKENSCLQRAAHPASEVG